jgi:hypothetical protein
MAQYAVLPSQATQRASWIDRNDRKLLIALAVVGLLFLISRIDAVRYQYMTQQVGQTMSRPSMTLLVKVDRFTGATYVLYPGKDRWTLRAN